MDEKLHGMRTDYVQGELVEAHAADDPIEQFRKWFGEVQMAGQLDANAMTVATVGPDGRPAARMMLLKDVDDDGFTFFTSYGSRKGQELDTNPHVALCFWWIMLERQVRIEGRIEKVAAEMSDEYFQTRPRASQVSAAVSPQSSVVANRAELEEKAAAFEAKLGDGPVPRPENWGGYRVIPDRIEFWQGRGGRLHDRLRYTKTDAGWKRERLAP